VLITKAGMGEKGLFSVKDFNHRELLLEGYGLMQRGVGVKAYHGVNPEGWDGRIYYVWAVGDLVSMNSIPIVFCRSAL